MQTKEIMTTALACCGPDTPLPEVARLMVERDCGEISVVDADKKPLGVVTDRASRAGQWTKARIRSN